MPKNNNILRNSKSTPPKKTEFDKVWEKIFKSATKPCNKIPTPQRRGSK